MKKILFIARCLEGGGVTKSILNLLNTIDCCRYEVHLFIMFDRMPELEGLLPKEVIIHKNSYCNKLLNKYHGSAEAIKQSNTGSHNTNSLSPLKKLLSFVNKAYAAWFLALLCPSIGGEYDTIVDYYGQTQLYYMVEKLKSKKKITFFHNDYSQFDTYKDIDKFYFPRVDRIFTISAICVDSIKTMFPQVRDKVFLMENISSPKIIRQLADEHVEIPPYNGLLLLTVGHVCERKGSDWAIEAARILKDKGYEFLWLIVGSKGDPKYSDLIRKYELDSYMMLYGETRNPYPLMKKADIVVHPSRFEGKSIVLDEAKIMAKPIVATNFSTVNDQLIDGVNASICEMSPEALANAISILADSPQQRILYSNYLLEHMRDNSTEVKKLYNIFDS